MNINPTILYLTTHIPNSQSGDPWKPLSDFHSIDELNTVHIGVLVVSVLFHLQRHVGMLDAQESKETSFVGTVLRGKVKDEG